MHYKTIVLALLQQRTEMHKRLRQERKLLTTLELYARELKRSHEAFKDLLSAIPSYEPSQISSQAMEMAVRELEDRLPPVSRPHEEDAFSLDMAMAYLRPTSRG
jgi:hypothetical protein